MSAEAVGWAWRHSPYKGSILLAHLAVADTVNDQHYNELWMSQRTLAEKARISRQSANAALQTFVKDGMLSLLEERTGKPSRYRFEFPPVEVKYESRRVNSVDTPVKSGDTGCQPRRHKPKRTQGEPSGGATKTKDGVIFLPGTGRLEAS